jgi:DNA polymerase V
MQTKFQKKVYDVVRKIPKGETLTYKEVAKRIGSPKACRAVGNALNKNRDPNVPCHRVIKSDGTPGGYYYGPSLKIERLTQEGAALKIPLFITPVSAGFPSPADDFVEKQLDLNEKLIKHPAATFFVKVQGDSMRDAGIHSGDTLVVDRSLEPTSNKVVIAVVNGEFTVKRVQKRNGKVYLMPENLRYKPIEVTEDMDCSVWGVVTNVIHAV